MHPRLGAPPAQPWHRRETPGPGQPSVGRHQLVEPNRRSNARHSARVHSQRSCDPSHAGTSAPKPVVLCMCEEPSTENAPPMPGARGCVPHVFLPTFGCALLAPVRKRARLWSIARSRTANEGAPKSSSRKHPRDGGLGRHRAWSAATTPNETMPHTTENDCEGVRQEPSRSEVYPGAVSRPAWTAARPERAATKGRRTSLASCEWLWPPGRRPERGPSRSCSGQAGQTCPSEGRATVSAMGRQASRARHREQMALLVPRPERRHHKWSAPTSRPVHRRRCTGALQAHP
mmetsp:Transcript_130897/g.418952  ORF Transcript_130897/g.418952 Transcript_130897/m.418952 type:complete len:289 (+) Transcript_130897:4513-5379(+)